MKAVGLFAMIGIVAAGCVTPVGEPRVINVSPASTAGATLSPSIDGLLNQTRQSYVTLVISKASRKTRNNRNELLSESVTSGSGFIIDPAGHVLTAGHVAVQPGWVVEAKGPDGRNYIGRVVAVKKDTDAALIKLRGVENAAPVRPVAQPCLAKGEPIFSLGKPKQQGDVARLGEVTSMSFGRPVTYKGFGYSDAMVLKLETRKGESGGPVFNSNGHLAGMVVSTLSDGTGRHLNLAHAITAPVLAEFVCANTQCSASWRAIRKINTSVCPAT